MLERVYLTWFRWVFSFLLTLSTGIYFVACTSIKGGDKASVNTLLEDADHKLSAVLSEEQKEHSSTSAQEMPFSIGHQSDGFYSGLCWYMYANTNKEIWRESAIAFQESLDKKTHQVYDAGIAYNCSFGNGFKLTNDTTYRSVLLNAGLKLENLFNQNVGAIKSIDEKNGWMRKRKWEHPVLISSMMNLELLFSLTEATGDKRFKNMAVQHADKVLESHFRADYSCYDLVDYDSINGNIRSKGTIQGYAHESVWSSGQMFALYGLTVCYRYTRDMKYLRQAEGIARFLLNHSSMPSDLVPYWDLAASKIPDEPRDVASAAILLSALVELDEYSDHNYTIPIDQITNSLASESYSFAAAEKRGFLLKSQTKRILYPTLTDTPLVYADYYFVEALTRMKNKQIKPKVL